jgi:antirestriction protein
VPIPCRMVDRNAAKKPGDMFYAPWLMDGEDADYYLEQYLSLEYKRDHLGKRPPIMVVLPTGTDFCVDCAYCGSNTQDGHGWTVIGEAPNITVSPSINHWAGHDKGWHGYLRDGELTDDLEGRKYD